MLNFDVKQQEIRLYQDGAYVGNDSSKSEDKFLLRADGRIAIGRGKSRWDPKWNNVDCDYSSVDVDELYFFNQLLPEAQIKVLSQQNGIACPIEESVVFSG